MCITIQSIHYALLKATPFICDKHFLEAELKQQNTKEIQAQDTGI